MKKRTAISALVMCLCLTLSIAAQAKEIPIYSDITGKQQYTIGNGCKHEINQTADDRKVERLPGAFPCQLGGFDHIFQSQQRHQRRCLEDNLPVVANPR